MTICNGKLQIFSNFAIYWYLHIWTGHKASLYQCFYPLKRKWKSWNWELVISFYINSRLHLYSTTFSFHTSLKHTLEQFIYCSSHSDLHSYMGSSTPVCKHKLKLMVKKSSIAELQQNSLSGNSNRKTGKGKTKQFFHVLVSHFKPPIYPSSRLLLPLQQQ